MFSNFTGITLPFVNSVNQKSILKVYLYICKKHKNETQVKRMQSVMLHYLKLIFFNFKHSPWQLQYNLNGKYGIFAKNSSRNEVFEILTHV